MNSKQAQTKHIVNTKARVKSMYKQTSENLQAHKNEIQMNKHKAIHIYS